MIIANPIYDVVFKRMMENDRVAKFFIGTLLAQTIETVELRPQEFTYTSELLGIAVFRLDFIATIKTDEGEYRKVLIEIQKARNMLDLMRFRNYLAEQYKKEDIVDGEKVTLPITTIYILGFKLPEIDTPCLKVARSYTDLVHDTTLETKSDFVEKLTHDSFIVQVERITDRYQTRLDKLLSVFEQTNFVDDYKIIKEFDHEVDLEEIKTAIDILHHAGTNPAERKQIEIEQEAWRSINAMFEDTRKKYLKELEESKKTLEESRMALEVSKNAAEENRKALEESKNAAEENRRALEESKNAAEENRRALEESKNAAEENRRALEESKNAAEENRRALEESKNAAEENRKALEESKNAAEENRKALTEKDQAISEKDRLIAELMRKLDEQK